jgi:hypothetical protein
MKKPDISWIFPRRAEGVATARELLAHRLRAGDPVPAHLIVEITDDNDLLVQAIPGQEALFGNGNADSE